MKYLSQYKISFSGLEEGVHQFDFKVDEKFFKEFEGSEIEEGLLDVLVKLEKRQTHLKLDFAIKGKVQLVCDRCLDNYIQPLDCQSALYVKFSEEDQQDDDEVIFIHPNDYEIGIGQLIYELIILNMPVKHVHPDNDKGESNCNQEMLQRLEDINAPGDDNEGDPRWDDLRKIIDN